MKPGAWRAALPLLLLLALAGCTGWPPPGRGGMAETRAPALPPETPPSALGERLACEVARIESLHQHSARLGVLSGRILVLQGASARVQREYHAGLRADASRNLLALQDRTNEVARDMPPGTSLPAECT